LEGTLKIIWFQPPCPEQGHLLPHQVAQVVNHHFWCFALPRIWLTCAPSPTAELHTDQAALGCPWAHRNLWVSSGQPCPEDTAWLGCNCLGCDSHHGAEIQTL